MGQIAQAWRSRVRSIPAPAVTRRLLPAVSEHIPIVTAPLMQVVASGLGVWTGAADLPIAVGNSASNGFQGDPDRLNIKLQPAVYSKVLQEGLVMTKSVAAPDGADQVRVVVRAATSSLAGSLVVPLRP
jgi:hypothetical protein